MSNLLSKYFFREQEEIKSLQEAKLARIGRISELVMTQGYRIDIKKWLEDTLEKCEPRPGQESEMILAIGVRDGLRIVARHLADLERDVVESKNE